MNEHILIITNNHRSSLSYSTALASYGYNVVEAQTFEGARIRLRARMIPEIIIIDVTFHANDRKDFIYDLLRTPEWAHIQVIVVQGDHAMDETTLFRNIDAVYRPVDVQDIIATIQHLEAIAL